MGLGPFSLSHSLFFFLPLSLRGVQTIVAWDFNPQLNQHGHTLFASALI